MLSICINTYYIQSVFNFWKSNDVHNNEDANIINSSKYFVQLTQLKFKYIHNTYILETEKNESISTTLNYFYFGEKRTTKSKWLYAMS